MRKLLLNLILICLLLLTGQVAAQESIAEIEELFALGKAQQRNDGIDTLAIATFTKALELLPEDAPDTLRGKILAERGTSYSHLYRFDGSTAVLDKAYASLQAALPLMESMQESLIYNLTLSELAVVLMERQNSEEALKYYKKAIPHFENLSAHSQLMATYSNMAKVYAQSGDYDKGILSIRKGLEHAEFTNEPQQESILLINLGAMLADAEQHNEAKLAYEKGIKKVKELGPQANWLLANIYLNLIPVHMKTEDFTQAKESLVKAEELIEELGDPTLLSFADFEAAHLYYNLENYDLASTRLDRHISFFEGNPDLHTLAIGYEFKARIFDKKSLPDSAYFYQTKSIGLFEQINDKNGLKKGYEFLSELEEKRGNYKAALAAHQKFLIYYDSVYNENFDALVGEEQVKQNLDAEQEAREKAELQASLLSSRNNLIAAIAAGLAGILLIGGYLFMQLRKTRNQLAEQNQQLKDLNATKDKFFGIIAHDVRSPITALDGVSEQMHYYLEKEDKGKLTRLADRIDGTAKRLTSLLDNLLNWALLQTGMIPYNPKSVSLNAVAEENLDLFRPIAEAKNISLSNEITQDLTVHADANALQTIIRNLLNNAIKFTPQGGEVSIQTEEKNDKVFIKINDTGTGISAEKLEKLFTLDKKSTAGTAGEKGSGLGLMLCRELVELNKGTIRAVSEVGKGSSFIFSLARG